MTKFRYRMQNILEIKYKLEIQAKSDYSTANRKLEEEKSRLDSLNNDIREYENRIRGLYHGKLNFKEIKCYIEAIEIKKISVKKQIEEVNKARKNLELAREKLNQVMIERKTHEKLKEKAFEEYKKQLDDYEKKEIDELISYSYNKIK